jgi:hypothetical protein
MIKIQKYQKNEIKRIKIKILLIIINYWCRFFFCIKNFALNIANIILYFESFLDLKDIVDREIFTGSTKFEVVAFINNLSILEFEHIIAI